MKITKVVVMITRGPDIVNIHTDLPCPFVHSFLPSQSPLSMSFEATKGTGIEYACTYFGLEPEIIDLS